MIQARPVRMLTLDASGGSGGRFIAAASGLVRTGDFIYVIADDERGLAVFPAVGDAPGRLVRILPGELPDDPAERKRRKPDFEALALLPVAPAGAALLALASGSRKRRREGVLHQLGDDGGLLGDPARIDLSALYEALGRDLPDLNIEGATVVDDRLLLFQRGNGAAGVNAVVELDLSAAWEELCEGALSARSLNDLRRYELGEIDGVQLCFSDATGLADGRVVFTAVAEGGKDTYLDGVFAGSAIGVLDPTGRRTASDWLAPPAKIEGVEAELSEGAIDLLMVADADDRARASPLLAARIER
jgi:Family of unknown function (DUF6929)